MIVCEVGLNHFGNENYANHYINKFLSSKADSITFQIREAEFYNKKKFANHKLSFEFYKSVLPSVIELATNPKAYYKVNIKSNNK